MKILFIHPNMPGQYKFLVREFAKNKENQVVFLTNPKPDINIENVTKIEYSLNREVSPDTHRYLISMERAVIIGQEVWRVCRELKQKSFIPDVIVGHLGWGDGMFLKDIYPDTPILSLFEFFYHGRGADVGFIKTEQESEDDIAKIRMKNGLHLFNLTYSDWGVCPTFFQRDQHPKEFFQKISVIHDGIDTDIASPSKEDEIEINGIKFNKKDEIITYISRNFEPYRGFDQFMRAAEIIQKRRPNARIILVGQDGVSYGKKPEGFASWRQKLMSEVSLDMSRFHFMGYLKHSDMIKVLQVSSAHIYLTVPFVLSWSMMEAMSCGCLMICSDTSPIREVMRDGYNGLLVDFFSPEEIAQKVEKVFADKDRMQELRNNARKTIVDHYDIKKLMPLHVSLVNDVASGKFPPATDKKIQEMNKKLPYFYLNSEAA